MGINKKTLTCPYCKEEIAPGAVICKHCGSSLKLPAKNKKRSFWLDTYMLGVYSGVILMVLLVILYNKIF
jgi:predicted nucleic acid-binding Zn ribbon protein